MTPSGYRYYRRQFLNRPGRHAGAYILASVETAYGHITIADCARVVQLEFDQTDARDHRNSLRKVDLLIETLTGFRDALVEADAAKRRI